MRLDNQPVMRPNAASTTATRATSTARPTTSAVLPVLTPSSMIAFSSRGGTTTSAASTTVTARKPLISRRCGRANPSTRRTVRRSILLSTTLRSLRRCRHGGPVPAPIDIACSLICSLGQTRRGSRLFLSPPPDGASAREGRRDRAESTYLRFPLEPALLVEVAVGGALQQGLRLGDHARHRRDQGGHEVRDRGVEVVRGHRRGGETDPDGLVGRYDPGGG